MATKRKKIGTVSIVLWLLLPATILAQENYLTGRVVDYQSRESVIGATVSVKNGGTGTITDIDGNFSFALEGEYPVTLDIRAIGYATQELDVYQPGDILIELVESFNRLTEVVVIGYGTQKKSELSGAISSIPTGALQQPLSSVDKALQGVSPGVQVTQTSGQPGGGVSIRVRGGSSIEGSSEPLYVIDGFPVTAGSSASAGVVSGATINPLSTINPSDIESIDILKDASATAIYGSRGANGVIIITTKRGKEGKSNVVYDGSVGFQSLRKKIDLLGATEFAQLRNEALYDKNPAGGEFQYLSTEEISRLGKGTDWQDAAFRTALVQNHQVSVTGGTDKIKYAVSGGYFQQEGILRGTDFGRFSGRVNLDAKVSDRFTIGSTVSGSRTRSNVAPSGVVSALLTMPPTATIYEADGSYTLRNPFENIISNPIASLNDQTNRVISFNLLANVFGEYKLYKGLTLKVSLGTDINYSKENSYIPSTLYEGSTIGGEASVGILSAYSWLNENTLNYLTTIRDKHNLNLLAGFTQQEYKAETLLAGAQNFVSDDLRYNSLQAGSVTTTPGSASQSWALLSYLGRINYNYDSRYFASVSFRADGSSRFGKNNKWGYFPSAALSWRASEESFFPKNDKVSDLKVRVSYGATGNQEIGLYQSLSTLTSVRYLIGDSPVIGFTPNRIANDDLGWETTYQFDAGVDVGFFRDRLSLTLDFYYKKTTDLLLSVEIPWTSGHATSLQNFGSVENKGLEIGIRSENIVRKDWNWSTDFNISLNRNKVLSINSESDSYISGNYIVQVGKPLGSFYGSVTDGVLQAGEEETKGSLTGKTSPRAGDRLYKDLDGDGSFSNAADRTIIGNAQPDFIFGLTNTIRWKSLDLSFLLQGSYGNDIINTNQQNLELFTGQQNASGVARNRWTPENTNTDVPRASSDPSNFFSSRFVEDGSYLRLKTLTLGWNIPEKSLKQVGIAGLRIYATGQNLLTWTSYSGFDPEVTSGSNVSPGNDSGIYPTSRSVSFGARVTF